MIFRKAAQPRGARNCAFGARYGCKGSLGGGYIRKALNLTSGRRRRIWCDRGRPPDRSASPGWRFRRLKEAVEKFVADGEARSLNPESLKKMRDAVERLFLGFCTKQGYRLLKQLGVDEVREFRKARTHQKATPRLQRRPG